VNTVKLLCDLGDGLQVAHSYLQYLSSKKSATRYKTKTRHEEKAGNKGNLLKSKGFNRF